MHWERRHVNPMLTLRNAACNERWPEGWHEITTEQRHHQHKHRQQQATLRLQQMLSSWMLLRLQFLPPTPKPAPPPRPVMPAATVPGSARPSPHHIWKWMPACRPKLSAKN
jgi:hypothetical protein